MEFKEHLKRYLDKENIDKLLLALSEKEQKGLFINKRKINANEFLKQYLNLKRHPFIDFAFLFDPEINDFGKDIRHDLGLYYIQDPASAMAVKILDPKPNDLILDMCASPGGKSLLISEYIEENGLLVANDISYERSKTLLANVERFGAKNIAVTSLDFSKCYHDYLNTFDKILLDVPCSGSAMFRRNKLVEADWSIKKVIALSKIQKNLIQIAYKMLRPGGYLLYSTCSYSFEENEDVIESLRSTSDAIIINIPDDPMFYKSKELSEAIHLFPHLFKGEGQFICLIQKPGELQIHKKSEYIEYIRLKEKYDSRIKEVYKINTFLPKSLLNKSIRPGLLIKTIGNNYERYSHHYSHFLSSENSIPLDIKKAFKYLKGEELNLDYPDGQYLVSYLNNNLGYVKISNKTAKNLYPKGLRRLK